VLRTLTLILLCSSTLFATETAIRLDGPEAAKHWKFLEKTGPLQNGELIFDGTRAMSRGFYLPLEWEDVKLSAKYMVESGPDDQVLACGFVVRAADAQCYYYVHFDRRSAILVR